MVVEENAVDPINVQTDPTHQEGISHIKDKLYERNGAPAVPPTDSTAGVTEHQPGLIDTVKTYLGYGNSGTATDDTATEVQVGSTVQPTAAAGSAGSQNQGADTIAPKTTEADKVNDSVSKTTNTTDAVTGAKSDPSDADQEDTKVPSNPVQDAAPKPADGKPVDPKTMEHRDAIPTAGGVRLGDKHWGESDVVPDDPKSAESEVEANTAKNTGSATAPDAGEQHTSTLDKIKAKLPGHNKE